MQQTITPNPNIPCRPGWCLAYVNEAFGVPKRYGTATAAWQASATQHRDRNFPADCWVPVWYGLSGEPAGHVVLLAPDRSVYSTSDLTNVPHHHPNLADLESYYAYYGMTLTYRGWTEDVEGTRVITPDNTGLAYAGTNITTSEEIDMSAEANILARLSEIVSWQEAKFQALAAQADSDRNALAGFVRDLVLGQDTLTEAELDAKLAALSAARPATNVLVKGDASDTVYAWDGGSGYRGLGYDEFKTLIGTGAAVLIVRPQEEIDKAVGGN